MNHDVRSNGAFDRLETVRNLLEGLFAHIHKHGDAMIRMDANEIEQHLAAEQSICEQLSCLSQLEPISARSPCYRTEGHQNNVPECLSPISDLIVDLRHALRTHSALVAKSKAYAVTMQNTYSTCRGEYPEQEHRKFTHP